jgi:hypothetical protein
MRAALLWLVVGTSANAAEIKPDVVFAWPDAASAIVDLEPGQAVQRTLLISNDGPNASTPISIEFTQPSSQVGRLGVDYRFETLTPSVCSSTEVGPNGARMSIASIPAGAQAGCTFDIRRDESSLHDITIASDDSCFWNAEVNRCGRLLMQIGSHPDLALTIAPIAPIFVGDTQAILRATVTNPSDIAIATPGFGSCGFDNQTQFGWDTDIAGGCGDAYAIMCVGVLGFSAPDVPPRGQSSCLIRLTFPPIQSPSGTAGLTLDHVMSSVGGRQLLDVRLANNAGMFDVIPLGREPAVVPLHPVAMATLMLLLLASAFILVGSKRTRSSER